MNQKSFESRIRRLIMHILILYILEIAIFAHCKSWFREATHWKHFRLLWKLYCVFLLKYEHHLGCQATGRSHWEESRVDFCLLAFHLCIYNPFWYGGQSSILQKFYSHWRWCKGANTVPVSFLPPTNFTSPYRFYISIVVCSRQYLILDNLFHWGILIALSG